MSPIESLDFRSVDLWMAHGIRCVDGLPAYATEMAFLTYQPVTPFT